MKLIVKMVVLCLALSLGRCDEEITPDNSVNQAPAEESSSADWGIGTLRNGFETVNGYFDSFLELLGGKNGVCQYRCRYEEQTRSFGSPVFHLLRGRRALPKEEAFPKFGLVLAGQMEKPLPQKLLKKGKAPMPRPNYKPQEPNGCSSYFLGLKVPESLDLGIPAMTKCCNQLDVCYDTCGANKYRCDAKFRWCLHSICSDLKRSLGFVSKVEACESVADTVFNTVWTLGCRPFMNSQRSACICNEEEREEL